MRLRFWIKSALTAAGILIVSSPLYSIILCLQDDELDLIPLIAIYMWSFGAVCAMIFPMQYMKQNLPLALSFGSSRKEALLGIQIYRLLPMVMIIAASLLLVWIGDRETFYTLLKALPGFIGASLLCGSIGTVIAAAQIKFGNKSLFFTIPAMILLFVGGIFLGVQAVTGFEFVANIVLSPAIVWIALAIGVTAHGLSLIPEVKTVYHYNVKL